MRKEVPIWEKSNLTLEEAAVYSGIGINKLRKMTDREDCTFVLWIGTKRLIKVGSSMNTSRKHTRSNGKMRVTKVKNA